MEKAEKELVCLREFQKSGAVIAINSILSNPVIRKKLDKKAEDLAIEKLIGYTRSAMAKAGIELNADGTEDFADAVFFDMQMDDESKINLLELCDDQHDRIAVLLREDLTNKGILPRS